MKQERQELVFDGIDLYGQVFLNGAFLGEARNAFVPASFNVRHKIKTRRNELIVRVTAGTDLVPSDEQPRPVSRKVYGNRQCWFDSEMGGLKALRKPQFSAGWDWVDALPNIGIWRSVFLRGASGVVLDDVRLDTVIEGDKVFVDALVTVENIHPWSERPCRVELTLTPPSGKAVRQVWTHGAPPGLSPLRERLEIAQPRLWWPNGMGAQPLYKVAVKVTHRACDGRISARSESVCARSRSTAVGSKRVAVDSASASTARTSSARAGTGFRQTPSSHASRRNGIND